MKRAVSEWRTEHGDPVWRDGTGNNEYTFIRELLAERLGQFPHDLLVSNVMVDSRVFGGKRSAHFLFCAFGDTLVLMTNGTGTDRKEWRHFADTTMPHDWSEAQAWLRMAANMAS